MAKQKSNSIELTFYNVVLQPVNHQHPHRYKEVFEKILNNKISFNTYSDKYTQMYSIMEWDGMLYGELVNYTRLTSKDWYNSATDKVEDHEEIDPALHPNAKKWDFFFLPATHTLGVTSKASVKQILKFFSYAFNNINVKEDDEEIQFNVISRKELIEQILEANDLTSLEINVSYSNNDSNSDWEEAIDNSLKESDVSNAKIKINATKRNPLKLIKDSILGGFLQLSRRNGNASATVIEDGKRKVISTESKPQTSTIMYQDEPEKLDNIKSKLSNIL